MKKLLFLIAVIVLTASCKSGKPMVQKYWHRHHCNKIQQQYQQCTKPGKGKLSDSFRPKGDVMRYIFKYY